ncbi:MAG: hypothetical protein RJA70_3157 [Pseudomonadota bacterium]|jgi:transporter family protein
MTWLTLTLLSALALGFYDVSKKVAVNDNAVLPVLLLSSMGGLAVLLPVFALQSWAPDFAVASGFVIGELTPSEHLLVLLKSAIVSLSWILSFFAVKHLPISIAAPVRASSPLFTVLGAVLLFAERPGLQQWAGASVIFASYVALSIAGRAEGVRFERNRWVLMLFAGTLVGAMSGLYDKVLLQQLRLDPTTLQFWFTAYNVLLQGVLVLLFWWPKRRELTRLSWRPSVFAVGALLVVADQLYFRALAVTGALVSVVSLTRRANVLISFPLGGLLFGEARLRQKGLIVLVTLLGVFLLLL